jgi:hypothetical protein
MFSTTYIYIYIERTNVETHWGFTSRQDQAKLGELIRKYGKVPNPS